MKKTVATLVLALAATPTSGPVLANNSFADSDIQIVYQSRPHRGYDRVFGDTGGRFYQRIHGWFGWGNHWEVDAQEQAAIDGQIRRIGDLLDEAEARDESAGH